MWDTGCVATCVLNLGARLRRVVSVMLAALSTRKESATHTEYEASSVAKQVRGLWRKENLLLLLGSICDSLTVQPVTQI